MPILKYFVASLILALSACSSGYDEQVGYGYATAQQTEVANEYFEKSPLFFGKANGPISIEFELEETNVYRILGAGGHVAGWAVFEEEGIIKIVNLDGDTTNILHPDKNGAYQIYDVDGTYMGVLGFEEENPDHYYITNTYGDPLGRVSVPVHPVYNPYGYYDSWGRYHGLGYGYGNPIWGHWGHGSRRRANNRDMAKKEDRPEQNGTETEPTPNPGWGQRGGEMVFDEREINDNDQYRQRPTWQADPRPRTTTRRVGPVAKPNKVWRLNRDELKDYSGERQIEARRAPKLGTNNNNPRPQLNRVRPRVFDERPTSQPRQQARPQQARPQQARPQQARPRIQTPKPQKVGKPQPVIRDNENNN